jgi:hypothetical protein
MLRQAMCAVVGLLILGGGLGAADKKAKKACKVEGYILKFLNEEQDRFQVSSKNKKLHTVHCGPKCKITGPRGGKHTAKELKKGDQVRISGIEVKREGKMVCEAQTVKIAKRKTKKGGK